MNWDKILKKFRFTWSVRHFFYRLDWTTANSSDVKEFLQRNVEIGYELQKRHMLPKFKAKVQDDLVMEMFKWVVDNIHYVTDGRKFGITEKWEDIDEILGCWYTPTPTGKYLKTTLKQNPNAVQVADCESMTTLLFVLCRINGINPLQVRLVAGTVKQGGHAWLEYAPDELVNWAKQETNWVILDPAYDGKNYTRFSNRLLIEEDDRYLTRWFTVTDI